MSESELLVSAETADKDNRPASAVEYFAAARAQFQNLPLWAELRFADNLRAIGRLQEAAKVLDHVSNVPPKKLWLLALHRGQIAYDAGDLESAVVCFRESVQSNPDSTVPYVYLAASYSKMQLYEDSIQTLLRGLQAKGDQDEIYLNLGYAYRAIGKYSAAKEAFSRALELTPRYAEAKEGLRDVASVSDSG